MRAIAGGITSGRVPAGGQAGIRWTAGATRPSVVGGVLAATAAADLSAVYLAWDARRLNQTGRFSSTVARIGRLRTRGRPARAAIHPTEVMPSRLISGNDGPSDDPPEELQ